MRERGKQPAANREHDRESACWPVVVRPRILVLSEKIPIRTILGSDHLPIGQ